MVQKRSQKTCSINLFIFSLSDHAVSGHISVSGDRGAAYSLAIHRLTAVIVACSFNKSVISTKTIAVLIISSI